MPPEDKAHVNRLPRIGVAVPTNSPGSSLFRKHGQRIESSPTRHQNTRGGAHHSPKSHNYIGRWGHQGLHTEALHQPLEKGTVAVSAGHTLEAGAQHAEGYT